MRIRQTVPAIGLPAVGLLTISLLTISLLTAVCADSFTGFGPYVAYVGKNYECGPGESNNKLIFRGKVSKFDLRKLNVLQTYTGTFNASTPLNDKLWFRMRLDSDSHGQWKQNALIFGFKDKACSTIRTQAPDVFRVLFTGVRMDSKECVIPPGDYHASNEPINWTFPKFPVLPYGSFRAHITMGLGEDKYFCHMLETYNCAVPRKH